MLEIAKEFGIPVRHPLPDNPLATVRQLMDAGLAANEIEAQRQMDDLKEQIEAAKVITPDYFLFGFWDDTATLGDLLNILMDLPQGISELVTHPGEVDDELQQKSNYVDWRANELAAVTHPSVRELVRSEGIELVNFGALR
jgi:chitin disaccharide deacetylase